ncbi:MAG: DNA polymerase III subunit alpha [Hellea sp.]|nr:DNA polymerase III subunit alpha [Hellea sp.]
MAGFQPKFIHLRSRSPYSILEGALKIGQTAERCARWKMPALALTDTHNMCGALEFSESMISKGIQPIIGVTLSVDLELDMQPGQIRHEAEGTIALLAQNENGYGHLMELSSSAYLDVEATDMPHIKRSKLNGRTDGVIALTGGPESALNRLICQGRIAEAENWLNELSALYPNRLYVELQRHGLQHEIEAEKILIDWAYTKKLPIVATNEPYFLDPEMHRAHDALLAISEGSYVLEKNRRKVSDQHYFKSEEQMVELFKDIPEALENTIEIAKRCAFKSEKRDPILPNFGDGTLSEGDILRQEAEEGLKARLRSIELAASEKDYFDRLELELGVIEKMGFPGYFLIVSDFIKWAKEQDIPVGPGRGSGAGSVVAWALLITDLDPLRYGLLFERFLNPERISMPDFDVDFCQERRGEVIRYVQEKYGEEQVAHIITFGTLQARAVVRDVGRVLQVPLGQVDRLAKLIPSNPANPVTLEEAIKMERGLRDMRDSEPVIRQLLEIALQLEGLYRNASTHAAGVVIGDRPLTELIPLYRDPRSDIPATQFTMKWAEKAGLVKFDFLGLKTLTVIYRAIKYAEKSGATVDLANVPTSTPEAYVNLAEGLSAGVFQLESSGMRDTLRKMAPDSIEELTALISLYRPGPMKNIDTYIDRKFGRVEIEYPHPMIEDILKETYGIIIYQEQVMQIAQVLSGYSLGEADILRRAMGKKDQAVMDQQKSRFVEGAVANGVDNGTASDIFELVNEFAGYGFNKSHAAAYAMISFQTAWLKAFYPTEFIAAIMSLDINNVEKLAQFHQEAKRMGIEIAPPCVNATTADFDVEGGKVLYALGAIKNVGLEAMAHLVEIREKDGPFKDLFDFARRVDTRIVNKRAFENLARSGAFDCLEANRAKAFASANVLQSIGSRAAQERQSAQNSLFGDVAEAMAEPDLPDIAPWNNIETLDHELAAVGFYLSGHPLESYDSALAARGAVRAEDIETSYDRGKTSMMLAGVVRKRQERMSKRNKRFAYVSLSDMTGDYEVFMGEDILATQRDILQAGMLIEVSVKADRRDGEIKLFTNSVNSLNVVERQTEIKGLELRLRTATPEALDALEQCFEQIKNVPSKSMGFVEVIAPLGPGREAHWRLKDTIGLERSIQKALKATKIIEKITEIAA